MIRTYELSPRSKTPLYAQLYEAIRADILSGRLPGGEKLPSKRALAEHLSLSKITVETAYAQLLDEGYLTSRERSGYFVAHMPLLAQPPVCPASLPEKAQEPEIAQSAAAELFPFSVWAKLMRSVILDEGQYLLQPVPNGGLSPLRQAIAGELARQRGLVVQPEQIVIGAGTEYFYALLVQFLGRNRRFAIEDPCHRTLAQVYRKSGAEVVPVSMDESGVRVEELEASGKEFWHTWHPRGEESLNTPEFKAELQQVVDKLRETVLKDLSSMRRFCYENGGKIPSGWAQNYGYVVETEHYEYCLRCNPVQGDYQAYLSCYDLNEQKINHAYQPLVGRIHFINGDAQQFTDAKAYLDCIREELPFQATSGFRFRTITQDPAVRKAVDDIVYDFYGEENPCREEDYNLAPSVEMQMGGM